jgi:riboflavin biosynthesis pyrimidine reductase
VAVKVVVKLLLPPNQFKKTKDKNKKQIKKKLSQKIESDGVQSERQRVVVDGRLRLPSDHRAQRRRRLLLNIAPHSHQ